MIVQPDFLTHWKTRKFCNRLKEKHAPLYVIRIWSLCHTSKSDVIPANEETIAAICEYDGDPKALMSALTDCEFLEPESNGTHIVHGWADVNQRLIHNWSKGAAGGRPKKTLGLSNDNPAITLGKPKGSLKETDGWMDGLDRGIDGTPPPIVNFTIEDCAKASSTIGMLPAQVEKFFHHYNSTGWLDAQGRKITSLPSLLAKWKANEASVGKKYSQPDEDDIKRRERLRDEADRKRLQECVS